MKGKRLTREEIVRTIVEVLEPLDFVYGAWQCGSAAFGRVDEWSDIDIVVDVEDDKVREIFQFTDEALERISPIELSIEYPHHMSPGAYQKVYRLKNTSKFLLIEICALKHSSTQKFIERETHNEVVVHFDKKNVTDIKPIDKGEFVEMIRSRIEQLESLFNLYQCLVEKELNRKNYIEDISFYQGFSLNPLKELLRIKYSPYRYNFKTRYIHYDLS